MANRQQARKAWLGPLLCLLPAIYLLGVVGYALAHFQGFASTPPYFVRYVLVPALLAALLVWTGVKASARTSALAGSNVCALFAGLFLYEGLANAMIVRQVQQSMEASATTASTGKSLPMGSTLRQINGAMRTARLSAAFLGGFPHRLVLKCIHATKGPIVYRADRYGFNNPDEIYTGQPLELVFVGDSFVEGICQEQGKGVPGRLRAQGYRAASLGLRGNGPLLELAALGRFGPVLRPRHTVLVYFSGNDWDNLQQEASLPWLREALSQRPSYGSPIVGEEQLRKADVALGELKQRFDTAGTRTYKIRLLRNFLALAQTWSALGLHYPELPAMQPVFNKVVARMRGLTKSWNGDLTIVYVPPPERFRGLLPNAFAFDAQRKLVTRVAVSQGVAVLDLTSYLDRLESPGSFYASDGHFSESGSQFVARLVAREVGGRRYARN